MPKKQGKKKGKTYTRVSDADIRPLDPDVDEDEANVEWSDAPDFTIPSKEGDDVPTTPERWYAPMCWPWMPYACSERPAWQ